MTCARPRGPMNNSEPKLFLERFQRGGFRCEVIARGRYRVVFNRTVSVIDQGRNDNNSVPYSAPYTLVNYDDCATRCIHVTITFSCHTLGYTHCSFGRLLCTACAGSPENSKRIDGCHHTPTVHTTSSLRVSQLTAIVSRGKLVDTWTPVYRGPNFPTELCCSRRSRRPRSPRHHFQRSSGREATLRGRVGDGAVKLETYI